MNSSDKVMLLMTTLICIITICLAILFSICD